MRGTATARPPRDDLTELTDMAAASTEVTMTAAVGATDAAAAAAGEGEGNGEQGN